MNRKPTSNTRGANASEKRFHAYTKESDCITCDQDAPSICHHAMGATYKSDKILIGHFFVLPLCIKCDDVITTGSRRKFKEAFGLQSVLWIKHLSSFSGAVPADVINAIGACNE